MTRSVEQSASGGEIETLQTALLYIANEGDALSGSECQEIAAGALGIPVPMPTAIARSPSISTAAADTELARQASWAAHQRALDSEEPA